MHTEPPTSEVWEAIVIGPHFLHTFQPHVAFPQLSTSAPPGTRDGSDVITK